MPEIDSTTSTKKGFTVIEVMLFLAITGLMLIGVLGGTYRAIATQRYQDSVRSFSEFLRTLYGEVISPESLGSGNSNQYAIYGKVAVFGLDDADHRVYTATLIGDVHVPTNSDGNFMNELKQVGIRLFCGDENRNQDTTLATYTPLWGAELIYPNKQQFKGTLIIARAPTSGTVHTAFSAETFNIKDNCQPDRQSASTQFHNVIQDNPAIFSTANTLDFCLRSENSNIIRDIQLTADGHNTSAINILEADSGESPCR